MLHCLFIHCVGKSGYTHTLEFRAVSIISMELPLILKAESITEFFFGDGEDLYVV